MDVIDSTSLKAERKYFDNIESLHEESLNAS